MSHAKDGITFVIAVNNRDLFERNFLASPALGALEDHQVLVQAGFASAAQAYNDAIDRVANDLIIFCHQDVLLPERWPAHLYSALEYLDIQDPNWGVLGVYGTTQDGYAWGHVYSSGLGIIGRPLPHPVTVQTLDEVVLIFKRSSNLRFDASLPHFHFYGTDICLNAAKKGMRSYAISAFCVHNTQEILILPREFYQCYTYIRRVWHSCLPIQTPCIRVTNSNLPVYSRRLREQYLRHIRRKRRGAIRLEDPVSLLRRLVIQ